MLYFRMLMPEIELRKVSDGANPACVYGDGAYFVFDAPRMDAISKEAVREVVAHELAHVYQATYSGVTAEESAEKAPKGNEEKQAGKSDAKLNQLKVLHVNIAALASEEYDVRKAAQKRILALGSNFQPQVEKARRAQAPPEQALEEPGVPKAGRGVGEVAP